VLAELEDPRPLGFLLSKEYHLILMEFVAPQPVGLQQGEEHPQVLVEFEDPLLEGHLQGEEYRLILMEFVVLQPVGLRQGGEYQVILEEGFLLEVQEDHVPVDLLAQVVACQAEDKPLLVLFQFRPLAKV
jgi:hypothetical protein